MEGINVQDFSDIIGATASAQVQMPNAEPLDYVVEDYGKRPKRILRRIKLSKEAPSE